MLALKAAGTGRGTHLHKRNGVPIQGRSHNPDEGAQRTAPSVGTPFGALEPGTASLQSRTVSVQVRRFVGSNYLTLARHFKSEFLGFAVFSG
jgi:hypothetical protein